MVFARLAEHQVYPIPPMSVDGRILRHGEAVGDNLQLLLHGGKLVISALNWMHGGQTNAERDVKHLSAAHRRIHARIACVLQGLVLTDEPILSHGGLGQFLRQTQLYEGHWENGEEFLTKLAMFRWRSIWNLWMPQWQHRCGIPHFCCYPVQSDPGGSSVVTLVWLPRIPRWSRRTFRQVYIDTRRNHRLPSIEGLWFWQGHLQWLRTIVKTGLSLTPVSTN